MNLKKVTTVALTLTFFGLVFHISAHAADDVTLSQETLKDMKGKSIKLESINVHVLATNKEMYNGKCDPKGVQNGWARDMISYGEDDAMIANQPGMCDQLDFDYLSIQPKADQDSNATLYLARVTGQVGGLFSRTNLNLDSMVTLDVSCQVKEFGGHLGFFKTKQVDCQLKDDAGRVTFTVE